MPAEQPLPGGLPRPEFSPLTEAELRSPGAVKLIYIQLADIQEAHRICLTDLQAERQRNENLTYRAHLSEMECGILRERLGVTGHKGLVVRLIEIGIVGLIGFAIDFAKSGERKSLWIAIILSVVLAGAVMLIEHGYQPESKKGEQVNAQGTDGRIREGAV